MQQSKYWFLRADVTLNLWIIAATLQQSVGDADHQGNDEGEKEEANKRVCDRHSAHSWGSKRDIWGLESHPKGKGEVDEIQVIRRVRGGKLQTTDILFRVRANLVVVQRGIIQGKHCVHE